METEIKKVEIKDHGFIPSVIDEQTHYILGDGLLNASVIFEDGHGWGNFLPPDEEQAKNGFESMNCTNYGTHHALATLGKDKYGATFQNNLSERFLGVLSGTTTSGNDPHKVAECIRKYGVIPEAFLPFDISITTWKKYYSPRPMSYSLFQIGQHWLKKYTFGHDWVFISTNTLAERQAKMKIALRYSPLAASVFAWSQHEDDLYYDEGQPPCHWVTVYDYDEGKSWSVFDSYDATHKKLDWNFNFWQCKRYALSKNLGADVVNDTPEPVVLPYILYLISWVIGLAKGN